jgi:hypothetical protein
LVVVFGEPDKDGLFHNAFIGYGNNPIVRHVILT